VVDEVGLEVNKTLSVKYTGVFHAKKSGKYEFKLTSEDASAMVIGGAVVVEALLLHDPLTCTSGSIYLKNGYYRFKLYYGNLAQSQIAQTIF